jgi:predicted TIM-barrel fold metal-dependent hydrolase
VEAAVAEIEKRAGDRRWAQVNVPPRGLEPLGRRRYWPILEACAANGFPVSLHLGGTSGHASTGGGWPSFYHEEHPSYVQTMQTLVTSLVCEGVFEQIPNLKIVLVEGGFAWLPALCWRLDKHWKRLKAEVPHLKKSPSEYVHEHVWVTTQPIEEPERPQDMLSILEWIGPDRVMFSTDYPHWDQDDPRYAFKIALPDDWKRKIYRDNAKALYNLD